MGGLEGFFLLLFPPFFDMVASVLYLNELARPICRAEDPSNPCTAVARPGGQGSGGIRHDGGEGEIRTLDQGLMSPLLYH